MQLEKNGSTDSALLNVHREIDITAAEVIGKFAEKRRQFYLQFFLCSKQFQHRPNIRWSALFNLILISFQHKMLKIFKNNSFGLLILFNRSLPPSPEKFFLTMMPMPTINIL